MPNYGLLEKEITLDLELDDEVIVALNKVLNQSGTAKYLRESIAAAYLKYMDEQKYAHCHFMALMMKRIDKQTTIGMMKRNAPNYVLSQYHYGWYSMDEDEKQVGMENLAAAAEQGHDLAKKYLFELANNKFQRVIKSTYYFYLIYLSMKAIVIDEKYELTRREF